MLPLDRNPDKNFPPVKRAALRRLIVMIFLISSLVPGNSIFAANYYVTNTLAAGNGSLSWAIDQTNLAFGPDSILFHIPASDPGFNGSVWKIGLASLLPYLYGGYVFIDGTAQTRFAGNTNPDGPEIQLTTSLNLLYGLAVGSPGNTIRGMVISGFQNGILLYGSYAVQNTVEKCYVGAGPSGTARAPNTYGVVLNNAAGNMIRDNLVSGNDDTGIVLLGKGTDNNFITGNLIGTDRTGMLPLCNNKGIVLKSLANRNRIGSAQASGRNVISSNPEIGIYIEASDSNEIYGNYLGTDITGNAAVHTGDSLYQGNGIEFNTLAAHNILGGMLPGQRNVISGHRVYGVVYYGHCHDNSTIGNYIGTTADGTKALPNATGVCLDGGSNHSTIRNNLISGNQNYGIFFVTRGTANNICQGNIIGLETTGSGKLSNDIGLVIATGSSDNLVGGHNPGEGNIISGNTNSGILVADHLTKNNIIRGNKIGTDITGTTALGNDFGITLATFSSNNLADSNLVSGNTHEGVMIYEHADSNTLIRNRIGTGITGNSPMANGGNGVAIDQSSTDNLVGAEARGNTIAFNGQNGILVTDPASIRNTLSANSIHDNVLRGIELLPPGPPVIDTSGNQACPNQCVNIPLIRSAAYDGATGLTTLEGNVFCTNPAATRVEVFIAAPESSGFGQGARFLGSAHPAADGTFTLVAGGAVIGSVVTATLTDQAGNTSEFSKNQSVVTGLASLELSGITICFDNITGMFCYSWINLYHESSGICVYSLEGKELFSKTYPGQETEVNECIPATRVASSHGTPGMVVVAISAGQRLAATRKVIIN